MFQTTNQILYAIIIIYIYTHTYHTIHTIYNLKNLLRFEFLNLWTVGHLWESFEPIFCPGHGQVSGTEPTAKLRFQVGTGPTRRAETFESYPNFPFFQMVGMDIYIYYIYIYV